MSHGKDKIKKVGQGIAKVFRHHHHDKVGVLANADPDEVKKVVAEALSGKVFLPQGGSVARVSGGKVVMNSATATNTGQKGKDTDTTVITKPTLREIPPSAETFDVTATEIWLAFTPGHEEEALDQHLTKLVVNRSQKFNIEARRLDFQTTDLTLDDIPRPEIHVRCEVEKVGDGEDRYETITPIFGYANIVVSGLSQLATAGVDAAVNLNPVQDAAKTITGAIGDAVDKGTALRQMIGKKSAVKLHVLKFSSVEGDLVEGDWWKPIEDDANNGHEGGFLIKDRRGELLRIMKSPQG
ncbi:hypothetical protein [Streptomyces sp. NPDC015131]|uniref:hypothetical protein n=1 Tax=Streptomyces sp. NPDC015131 TaxID=3364941 RepID=UPI003701CFDF